jgi:hypothetical protein
MEPEKPSWERLFVIHPGQQTTLPAKPLWKRFMEEETGQSKSTDIAAEDQ